jgi:RNA polymerase sigma-32 factor
MAGALPVLATEGGLSRYLDEIRKFPMLEPNEEFTLAKDWREKGDRGAAHRLVTSHLRLVAKIAMGYRGYGLPIGEVVSEPPTPCGGSRRRSKNTSCVPGRS